MQKLALFFLMSLLSIVANAERFSYQIKSLTIVNNGLDRETISKNTVIIVDTNNSTVTIEGQKYQIVSSAWGAYPYTNFYIKGNNDKKFKVMIDYDYNLFIIDYGTGYARKYKFSKSNIN